MICCIIHLSLTLPPPTHTHVHVLTHSLIHTHTHTLPTHTHTLPTLTHTVSNVYSSSHSFPLIYFNYLSVSLTTIWPLQSKEEGSYLLDIFCIITSHSLRHVMSWFIFCVVYTLHHRQWFGKMMVVKCALYSPTKRVFLCRGFVKFVYVYHWDITPYHSFTTLVDCVGLLSLSTRVALLLVLVVIVPTLLIPVQLLDGLWCTRKLVHWMLQQLIFNSCYLT